MTRNRRAFLKQAGVGALGAAAVLIPGQAEAFHRRARIVTCAPERGRRLADINSVSFSFPYEGGGTGSYEIYGGTPTIQGLPPMTGTGSFCVWGCYGTNVRPTPTAILINPITLQPLNNPPTITIVTTAIALGTQVWGVAFTGVPVNVQFLIQVQWYTGMMIGSPLQTQNSGVCVAAGYG